MITMRQIRPWLFIALLALSSCALAVAVTLHGRPVAAWLVQHGLRGIWGKVGFLAILLIAFMIVSEASLRLAYLGDRIPSTPGAAKAVAFTLGVVLLTFAWFIPAHFLARLLEPHVAPSLAEWLETLLLVLGVLTIAAGADRLAPRLGINLRPRHRP